MNDRLAKVAPGGTQLGNMRSRHQALLEALEQGYCAIEVMFDDRGQACDYLFLETNVAFERLTGITDAVGRTMREISPSHEAHWFERYGEVVLTGKPTRFQDHAATLGSRWYDVLAYPVDLQKRHVGILFSDVTASRLTTIERDLAQRSEQEMRALVDALSDSAPIGLGFLDTDLRFRRINQRLAEINGISASDHLGRRPHELLPGMQGMKEIQKRWKHVLATGEPWLGVEVRGETPAQPGVVRTWIENFFPVRVGGEIAGLGIVVEEITQRRMTEEALATSEARFRRLIELSPVGISLSERDGRIVLANDAFLHMLGYTREEAAQLNWVDRTPPEHLPLDLAYIERLRRGEMPVPIQKDYVRRDGTRVSTLVVAQFVPGEADRMMAFALDVTAQKAADEAVRESAAQLRRLIDNMAGFVAMLDREGTLLEIGEPALKAGGLGREEVIGKKFWECPWWTHDREQQQRIRKWIEEALAGKTVREDVVAQMAGDGRLAIDFMLAPVFGSSGEVTHIVPSGIDISERKRIENALRENEERLSQTAAALQDADRRKDDFLATLAHELRNPLAPIRNGVQILRLMAGGNLTLERTTEMMERQMQHLVRLVDDLLDVSRITRGKFDLRRDPVLLNQVVSGALESCQTLFDPRGHELRVRISPEPLTVQGDADRLRQVFSNLLSNAAKFTPPKGTIWVLLERHGEHALVRVRDTGIGIASDRLQSVFEMFSQGQSGRGNDGLGIGLALVRQLVQLHGGWVTVESGGPGQGSTFTVCLPLSQVSEKAKSRDTAVNESQKPRRVLVVDDNLDAAESLKRILVLQGHEARVATSGAEALAAVAKSRPDVIFMDIGMPDMDGLETTRRIRAQPAGSSIRIVALTGWGQESDRRRTRDAGLDDHLVKPVSPDALSAAL